MRRFGLEVYEPAYGGRGLVARGRRHVFSEQDQRQQHTLGKRKYSFVLWYTVNVMYAE